MRAVGTVGVDDPARAHGGGFGLNNGKQEGESQAPRKAELAAGGYPGAEEEEGMKADPLGFCFRHLGEGRPFMVRGAQGGERLSLQCSWGIQGDRDWQGLLGSGPQKRV